MNSTTQQSNKNKISNAKLQEMLDLSTKLHKVTTEILDEQKLQSEIGMWDNASTQDFAEFIDKTNHEG